MKTSAKQKEETYHTDVANHMLNVLEWTYGSVSHYQAVWAQIHPQDQADWLQSCREVLELLEPLEQWRCQDLLSEEQARRFASIEEQRQRSGAILVRLNAGRKSLLSEPYSTVGAILDE